MKFKIKSCLCISQNFHKIDWTWKGNDLTYTGYLWLLCVAEIPVRRLYSRHVLLPVQFALNHNKKYIPHDDVIKMSPLSEFVFMSVAQKRALGHKFYTMKLA